MTARPVHSSPRPARRYRPKRRVRRLRATDHVEDGLPGTEVSDCGRVPSQRAHPGGAVWAPAAWRIKRAAPILPARCELDSCRRGAWRSPSSPLLGAILGVVLFSESARVPLRTPFVPRSARGEPTTIALEGREGRSGHHGVPARRSRPPTPARSPRRSCSSSSRAETPRAGVVSGELRVRGSECAFTASGRDAIGVDQPTVFRRSPGCSRPETLPPEPRSTSPSR